MREFEDEQDFNQWASEHDLQNIWRCPSCGEEYESPPGLNEALPCSRCGAATRKAGETYAA